MSLKTTKLPILCLASSLVFNISLANNKKQIDNKQMNQQASQPVPSDAGKMDNKKDMGKKTK